MSNTDIDERQHRKDALATFADAGGPVLSQAPSNPGMMPMGSDRVYGAQHVQVYRDDARVLQKLAALGAAAGDDWFYRFPVKSKDGSKSFIEGPSIKLANDLARIYGNCSVDVRVFDLGKEWIIYARFMDYETGFDMTRPFQQNKGASKIGGKGDDADARRLDIALQIGVSKAIRNVVVNALQTFADHAFNAAKNSLVDRIGKDIGKWQAEVAQRLKDRGVELQRVEYVIGRVMKDWTAPDVARIIAMMKAVADGMATIDETFPPKSAQTQHDPETGEVTSSEGEIALAQTANADGGPKEAPLAAQPSEAGPSAGENSQTSPANPTSTTENAPKDAGGDGAKPTDKEGKAPKKAAAPQNDSKGGAAAATDKPDSSQQSTTTVPTTEAQYVAHAEKWISEATDAEEAEGKWASEKTLRNKSNTGPEAREQLQVKLKAKVAEIRDANAS